MEMGMMESLDGMDTLGTSTIQKLENLLLVAVPRDLFAAIPYRLQWFGVPPPW